MSYVNLTSQRRRDELPNDIDGLKNPSLEQAGGAGWRSVNAEPVADSGYVLMGHSWIQDGGDSTGALPDITQITQAAYDAQVVAAEEARKDSESDPSKWDRINRAAIELIVDEINTLRAEHSLAARTPTQIKNALRNKLDSM